MLEFFSSYIKNFLAVALCAFMCETAASLSGKGKTLSKALGLICSLCVFLAATFPLISIINFVPTKIEQSIKSTQNKDIYNENEFVELMKQQLEKETIKDIYDNTGILIDSISIDLSIENDEFIINGIEISRNSCTDEESNTVKERLKTVFGEKTQISFTE